MDFARLLMVEVSGNFAWMMIAVVGGATVAFCVSRSWRATERDRDRDFRLKMMDKQESLKIVDGRGPKPPPEYE